MKQVSKLACSAIGMALVSFPAVSATVMVTNDNDSGPGSFRAAIGAANADTSITTVKFRRNTGQVDLTDTVIYTGSQPLAIDGNGATIDGGGDPFNLFVGTEGGGDLSLRRITFQNGGLNGVVVEVPIDAMGELSVLLHEVTIRDNADFGLLIDDLTNSSPASVSLDIAFSSVTGNGMAASDLDGIRVNEGGDGDAVATVNHSKITDNGADGLEIDESDDGDALLIVRHTTLERNGARFLETDNEEDADDGLDVDEAGNGDIRVRLVHVDLDENTDDGIGIDEADDGSMELTAIHVDASNTGDKGFSIDEGGVGDLVGRLTAITAQHNAEDGINMEEGGDGDLDVRVVNSTLFHNVEDGIDLTEGGDGDFDARVVNSTVTDNMAVGIRAEQEDPGTGLLGLINVTFGNNGGGPTDTSGVTVIPNP